MVTGSTKGLDKGLRSGQQKSLPIHNYFKSKLTTFVPHVILIANRCTRCAESLIGWGDGPIFLKNLRASVFNDGLYDLSNETTVLSANSFSIDSTVPLRKCEYFSSPAQNWWPSRRAARCGRHCPAGRLAWAVARPPFPAVLCIPAAVPAEQPY